MNRFTNVDELVANLDALDYSTSGLLYVSNGEANAEEVEGKLRTSENLLPVASHDGFVSWIRHGSNVSDHSARTDFFDYHYDGAYLGKPPDICALYCVDPGEGRTPTHFVDSRRILERILQRGIEREILERTDFVYQARDGLTRRAPIVRRHPSTNEFVLNCCAGVGHLEPRPIVSASVELSDSELAQAWALIQEEIRSAIPMVVHWSAGTFVVWDNFTYLHARIASSPDLRRTLVRFWCNVRRK